jgi:hypothetical protein
MSLSLDLQYTHLVSTRFEKFVRKGDYLFNCRCPICGDSKKNKAKMRGFIYRKGNDLFYKCHNCAAGLSLGNLIKQIAPDLHKEYVLERYKTGEDGVANRGSKVINVPTPRFDKVSTDLQYEKWERCDRLPSGHFCLTYLEARKIPKEFYSKLYFTKNYKELCDEINPQHGKIITADARLVIPFFDEYNAIIGISGRALTTADSKLRYIKIKANDNVSKLIFGLDRLDRTQTVKIVEGELDSLFLSNCIASGDSSLYQTAENISTEKIVLIYDNEPRNKEIVKLMADTIKSGHNVVIWPNTIEQKDINDMVKAGLSPSEIEDIISNNTFNGLEAQTNFVFWKKV